MHWILCLFFIICGFTYLKAESAAFLKKEHSLAPPYTGSWDFGGSTLITGSHVKLTTDRQSQQGFIWNTVPSKVRDWEAHLHFRVSGNAGILFGDGLAVWYTKDHLIPGPVFGSKDYFKGLGIFLDTYSNHNGEHNHQHPYISAMINNGTLQYDHDTDGTHTQIAGCHASVRNKDFDTLIAIRYTKNTLTVSTDVNNQRDWAECFSVSGVILPTGYHFGLSASTGDLADNHDIISFKVYELDVDHSDDLPGYDPANLIPSSEFFEAPRDHRDDKSGNFMSGRLSGLRIFVIIIVALIGIGVCVLVGFLLWSRQENSRKRFY